MRSSSYLNQHWTQKGGKYAPKLQFKTIDDVLEYMTTHHIKDIYTPYICKICGMWHIGHEHKKRKRK